MHPYSRAVLASVLLLAGCKIERTPPQILDPGADAREEQQESQAELQTRVVAFNEALGRGDRGAALLALNPAPDARVMTPRGEAGSAWEGREAVTTMLDSLFPADGAAISAPDLRVQVNARRTTGWFSTHLELAPEAAGDSTARRLGMSGVFSREEGEWRLVQIHLSRPDAPQATDTAAVDSAGAGR